MTTEEKEIAHYQSLEKFKAKKLNKKILDQDLYNKLHETQLENRNKRKAESTKICGFNLSQPNKRTKTEDDDTTSMGTAKSSVKKFNRANFVLNTEVRSKSRPKTEEIDENTK